MLSSLTYDISTTRQSKGRVTNVPLLFVCLTATSNLLLVSSTGFPIYISLYLFDGLPALYNS